MFFEPLRDAPFPGININTREQGERRIFSMKKGKRERERLRRDFTSQLNVTLNSNKLNYYCSSCFGVAHNCTSEKSERQGGHRVSLTPRLRTISTTLNCHRFVTLNVTTRVCFLNKFLLKPCGSITPRRRDTRSIVYCKLYS